MWDPRRASALVALAITFPLAGFGQPALQPAPLPAGKPFSFSNIRISRSAEPHAEGARVDLYRRDGRWAGFIAVYTGPVADPPVGRLDALQVDEGAGTISFSAKLSLGVTLAAQERVPSRDIVEFSGRLDTNALTGVLVSRLVNDGAMRTASTEKVIFDRDPDLAAVPSYAEWLAVWDARMKVRGPRW